MSRAEFHLWPSLHRSQISENFDFKEYVIDAGSGSRNPPAKPADLAASWGQKFSN
jgi:hypothetical protein